MTDDDFRLKALFAEDAPPLRDPVFSTAVMEELARRRFVVDMALLTAATVAGGFALWACWPVLQPALRGLSASFAPVMACLTLAATIVGLLDRRLLRAFR